MMMMMMMMMMNNYSLNYHIRAMLVFRMLCRITRSSKLYRTESVSVMDHEQTIGSELQTIGPETAKHLWPYLVVLDVSSATHFMPLATKNILFLGSLCVHDHIPKLCEHGNLLYCYTRTVSEWTKDNTVSFGLRDMIRCLRDCLSR